MKESGKGNFSEQEVLGTNNSLLYYTDRTENQKIKDTQTERRSHKPHNKI
jgi:hypothetical protein